MSLKNIRVVLVRPMYGGNMGSVCRAMKNMGLSDLAVVSPQETINPMEARMMAHHASDILEARKTFDSVAGAVADCTMVAGTTGRAGLYRSHAKTPREWTPDILRAAHHGRVALVFGPEDSGLSNEELALCTRIIRIPSSKKYASINLAQAVMICCYELYVADDTFDKPREWTREASVELRERMLAMWREMLLEIDFFEAEKADHMMMAIRRIFSRGPLSEADVNILMGIARQMIWFDNHKKSQSSRR